MAEVVVPEKVKEVEQEGVALIEAAKSLAITDADSYEAAAEFVKGTKRLQDRVHDIMDPVCTATNRAHKAATGQRKKLLAPAKEAERIVKRLIVDWDTEQRRLEAEARRKAEAEERRKAEEEQLAEAEAAAAEGDEAAAEEILEREPMVAPPPPPRARPKVSGVSTRETWKAQVTDIRALCKAIGEGKVATTLVQPNMPALNAQARSLKAEMKIPGVRAVANRTAAASGR